VTSEEKLQMTQLSPGDKVLITSSRRTSPELVYMLQSLRERFPGVEFTLTTEVADIEVERA
jgi:hypothetical protein